MEKPKLLTTDPGAEVDRRARAYLAKHPKGDYVEAVKAVLRKDRSLLRAYNEEPRFRELRLLSDFLNGPQESELRQELLSDVQAVLSARPIPITPASALSQKLNSLNLVARCVPVLDNKRLAVSHFSFRVVTPDRSERSRVYALLASALQSHEFKRLRQCPTCKTFFVALDHRERFCEKSECKETARRGAAREGMRKKRESARKAAAPRGESPLERFLEFMTLQRKANPSDEELRKTTPIFRVLGGVHAARKLIAEWERKYPHRPKAIWRELSEEQREIFSPS